MLERRERSGPTVNSTSVTFVTDKKRFGYDYHTFAASPPRLIFARSSPSSMYVYYGIYMRTCGTHRICRLVRGVKMSAGKDVRKEDDTTLKNKKKKTKKNCHDMNVRPIGEGSRGGHGNRRNRQITRHFVFLGGSVVLYASYNSRGHAPGKQECTYFRNRPIIR